MQLPVVLLHGALRSRAQMLPAAVFLRRRGCDARTFGYRSRPDPIERHAQRLSDFLRDWFGTARVPLLGFLGHSMGGLVARAYLARPEATAHSEKQRVVMLGTPNRGAVLAELNRDRRLFRAVYGRAADELLPERANRLAPLPPTARVLVLAGGRSGPRGYHPQIPNDNDGLVGVQETALPGVEPVVVGGIHTWLPWRPDVLERAARFLVADVAATDET